MMIGGCNHLEKYESQWEGLSYILWKINMFQTTNQMMIGIPVKRTSADSAQWLCVGRRQVGKCLPGESETNHTIWVWVKVLRLADHRF